jgi:hypothetical protein
MLPGRGRGGSEGERTAGEGPSVSWKRGMEGEMTWTRGVGRGCDGVESC